MGYTDDPTSQISQRPRIMSLITASPKRAPHCHQPMPCVRPFRGRRRRHSEWKPVDHHRFGLGHVTASRGRSSSLTADFRLLSGACDDHPVVRNQQNQKPTRLERPLELVANSSHSAAGPLGCTDLGAAKATILVSCPIVVLRDCLCETTDQVILIHGFCKKTHCSVL